MTYTPNYTGVDLASIVIDVIGSISVQAVSFAALIGLVLVFKWFKTGKLPF